MQKNHTVVNPLFFNEVTVEPARTTNRLNKLINIYNEWLKCVIRDNKALIEIYGRDILIDIEEGRQTWAREHSSIVELMMLMKSEIDRLSPNLINIVHTK